MQAFVRITGNSLEFSLHRLELRHRGTWYVLWLACLVNKQIALGSGFAKKSTMLGRGFTTLKARRQRIVNTVVVIKDLPNYSVFTMKCTSFGKHMAGDLYLFTLSDYVCLLVISARTLCSSLSCICKSDELEGICYKNKYWIVQKVSNYHFTKYINSEDVGLKTVNENEKKKDQNV